MAEKTSTLKKGPLATVLPLVFALTILWGTNWVLFPLAVQEVSVWTFRAICLMGSGTLLLVIARVRGISVHVQRKYRWRLALAALVYLVIWNIGSTYAAVLIPSGQAAVLGFTMPLWITLFSWIALGDRPTARLAGSVILATGGVALLAFGARESYANAPLGFVLGLSAGMGWAIGTLLLKRSKIALPPIVSTGWQLLIAGTPITLAALAFGTHDAFVPSPMSVLVIGYITVIPMALGNIAWFSIVDKVPAVVSGVSTVMVPMVAMATGAIFRGEPLGFIELCAMACWAAALLLVLVTPQPQA